MSKLSDIRREYTLGGLNRDELPAKPMDLFATWLEQVRILRFCPINCDVGCDGRCTRTSVSTNRAA